MPSGLQYEVIHLYRRALRTIRTKPAAARPKFLLMIRHAFRSPNVSPTNFTAIEFLIRKGQRQIETWADPSVKDCWVSDDMRKWAQERGWKNDK
ncbi:hypothetical protein M422DRAFT_153396 [Sphaerobolus stellatus SS14]|nr:hypothetical protein M422DRAFT_153396 [Sphaerobolus stellatus SS14]